MDLKAYIRTIPDFPSAGIQFIDITTVLKNPDALRYAVDVMAEPFAGRGVDLVIGPESRGFIVGMPMAYKLGAGFVPARKQGKLPAAAARKEYALEYGAAVIEIHRDAVAPGQNVIIADDLLATGGTAKAVAELVEEFGGRVVAFAFLVELEYLKGRDMLKGYDVFSVMKY